MIFLMLTTAMAPFASASSDWHFQVRLFDDTTGDNVDGGGAADILGVGIRTDWKHNTAGEFDVRFMIEVADAADHPKLVYYQVNFTINGEAYRLFGSYSTSSTPVHGAMGALTSAYLETTTTLTAVDTWWNLDNTEGGQFIFFKVEQADIDGLVNGTILENLEAITSHGATGSYFDTAGINGYRVGDQHPPAISIADQTIGEGSALAATVTGSDGDGDAVTLTATELPAWASFDAATGDLTGTPGYEDAGVYTASFTGSDGATSVSKSITITVTDTNRAPTIDAGPDHTISETQSLTFTVTADDADGDDVTLTVDNLPAGASFDAATGDFAWTPDHTQAGVYTVTFTASDGTDSASDDVEITVSDLNRPCEIVCPGDQSVDEDELLTFTVSASDPDTDDTVTLTASGLPSGATFDAATGEFSWTPGFDQSGEHTVTFTADDGTDSASCTVTILVGNVNRAPVVTITPDPVADVTEGDMAQFVMEVSDPDGDLITGEAVNVPDHGYDVWNQALDGATTQNGRTYYTYAKWTINWTTDDKDRGVFHFQYSFTDDAAVTPVDVPVTVLEGAGPVIDDIPDATVYEGQELALTATATDPDDDGIMFSVSGPAGVSIDEATGALSWTPGYTDAGQHTITVTASDGALSDSTSFTVTVLEDNGPPSVDAGEDVVVDELETVSLTVATSDPDGDTLTVTAEGLPAGATFDSATGAFEWVPDVGDAGEHTVTFTATDGTYTASDDVLITVEPLAHGVSVVLVGNRVAEAESPGDVVRFTFNVTNTGEATDTFTLSASVSPGAPAAVSPSSTSLAPGEYVLVDVDVTVPGTSSTHSVAFTAAGGYGAVARAFTQIVLPVHVSVALDQAVFSADESITGTVTVTYNDGTPAEGAGVRILERLDSGLGGSRFTFAETDEFGEVNFDLGSSDIGAGAYGDHVLEAQATRAIAGTTSASTTYTVEAVLAGVSVSASAANDGDTPAYVVDEGDAGASASASSTGETASATPDPLSIARTMAALVGWVSDGFGDGSYGASASATSPAASCDASAGGSDPAAAPAASCEVLGTVVLA